MKFLVCSKISIPAKDRTLPAWEYLRSLGHTVIVEGPNSFPAEPPDVLISMGVSILGETLQAMKRFPGVPLFAYNWDCYEWVWTRPRKGEYDYKKYGELLKQAREVWVPSRCTGLRTKEWWGIDNWAVIRSACPYWEHDDIRDDGYALCTLREIPDPWWGVFENTCKELGIPFRTTKHEVSYKEYQDAVAHCRFLVSPLYELSTGGLTLMEGYYHGKSCLLSDSEWHGGRDYMGDRARYFVHGDLDSFKKELMGLYLNPPKLNLKECKEWVVNTFSDKRMIDDMLARVLAAT